jgi:hypothetical protein
MSNNSKSSISSQHDKLSNKAVFMEGRFYDLLRKQKANMTRVYQTISMPIVSRFAQCKAHPNQMKTEIAVQIVTFYVNLLKTVKIPYFCHLK